MITHSAKNVFSHATNVETLDPAFPVRLDTSYSNKNVLAGVQ